MKKNSLKEWFIFSRRDRNAAIILLAIITTIMVLPYFFPAKKLEVHVDAALQAELDKYKHEDPRQNKQTFYAANYTDTTIKDTIQHQLFYFDPNTLDETGFVNLGLPAKTIRTLINYRSKSGYFKKPEDIRKIYGLSSSDAERLIPYIRITSKNNKQQPATAFEKPQTSIQTTQSFQTKQLSKTEINTATVDDWKAFPGIGDVLANRIVKFRNSMGGFKYVDQVAKTYGLSDSVFQIIKPYLYLDNK